ncbi:MAG: hypothetical protein WDN72_08550 [Alphaproteobacteria bacterium]
MMKLRAIPEKKIPANSQGTMPNGIDTSPPPTRNSSSVLSASAPTQAR